MNPPAFCPSCFTGLGTAEECVPCGLAFTRRGALLDRLGDEERPRPEQEVEGFYTRSPFPGYAPEDDGPRLLERARGAPFLAALDAALPPDARVLDCGAGTGQLAAFLALAAPRRRVVAIDGCRASLELAETFRARAELANLQLVRADLFDLPVRPGSYTHVISRGVVHHTPEPYLAIEHVARCVAPGGYLVLGFYETLARLAHSARRQLGRVVGRPIAMLDPVLRRRDLDAEKRRIWIDDQYHHPLEHILPLPRVLDTLRALGFAWVRSVPPAARGTSLFDPTPEPTPRALLAQRLGLACRGLGDPDAGLVCVVARRHGDP